MCFAQRVADLLQHVHHSCRLHRSVELHEAFEADAVEQLHDVVELAVLGDSEVVHVDRVRGAKHRRIPGFPFEASYGALARTLTRAEHIEPYELDRGRPSQQSMPRQPDLAHSTLANPLDQLVAADLAEVLQAHAESMDNSRDQIRDDGAQVIRREIE